MVLTHGQQAQSEACLDSVAATRATHLRALAWRLRRETEAYLTDHRDDQAAAWQRLLPLPNRSGRATSPLPCATGGAALPPRSSTGGSLLVCGEPSDSSNGERFCQTAHPIENTEGHGLA